MDEICVETSKDECVGVNYLCTNWQRCGWGVQPQGYFIRAGEANCLPSPSFGWEEFLSQLANVASE